jgi:CheY-like chemotaxis protein
MRSKTYAQRNRPCKILLVEDNELNRDMLRHLERAVSVLIAVDGAQGVAMAQSEAPDLVLMDMSLPVGRLGSHSKQAAPGTGPSDYRPHASDGRRPDKAIEADATTTIPNP